MLNVELNPSRRTRSFKIIDEMKFTIPVDREFLSYRIKETLNHLIYGSRYSSKISSNQTVLKLKSYIDLMSTYPDDYIFSKKTIGDDYWDIYRGNITEQGKEEFYRYLFSAYEHARMNLKEFGTLNPEYRYIKLETLPKQFSDYIINYVIKKEIYDYILNDTFAGQIISYFNNYSIDVIPFMSDSDDLLNKKKFQAEQESLFALKYCQDMFLKATNNEYVDKKRLDKQQNELAEYEMVMFSASMSFLNSQTKDLSEEEYTAYQELWNNEYKSLFYSILKRNMERGSQAFSRTEKNFKYKNIDEAIKDFFKNVRTYKNNGLVVESMKPRSVFHIFTKNKKLEGRSIDVNIYHTTTFRVKGEIDNVSVPLVCEQLVHYSEMINVIPELKNYKISTSYSFGYHDFNMELIELDHAFREGLSVLKELEKDIIRLNQDISNLHMKSNSGDIESLRIMKIQETNIKRRIDHFQTVYRNIDNSTIVYRGAREDLLDYPEHMKKKVMLSGLREQAEKISYWIEKTGYAKKNPRNSYDWGTTVLDFNKDYKPFINYNEYQLKIGDGFFWEKIPFGFSEKERDTMGHCGNAGRDEQDVFYSLRRRYKNNTYSVHVTLTVNKILGVTIECKGRGNMPPVEQYWPYLVELFIRDDLIACAESGLGHDPRADFNINMSEDAVLNRDKIEKIKPYLFSKDKFVYNFLAEKSGVNDKQTTMTRSEILKKVSMLESSFATWFISNGRVHTRNNNLLEPIEANPKVFQNKIFKKIKDIIENDIIDNLLKEKTIVNNTFMTLDETYILNGKKIFESFAGYTGREFFDKATNYFRQGKKVPMSDLFRFGFEKISYEWDTVANQKMIVEYLNEISGNGFEILKKENNQENNKIYRIDFEEFTKILASDNKRLLWFAPYITNDDFYELTYEISSHDINDIRSNHIDDIIELIDDLEIKDFIKDVILRTDEDGLLYDDNIDILEMAISGTIKTLYENDINQQMYSQFNETVSAFFDYNPNTKKLKIMWNSVIGELSEKYDENPLELGNFYELIRPVLSVKLGIDKNINLKIGNYRYSSILQFMSSIFDKCADLDSLNILEFEPDVDLYDKTTREEFAKIFGELVWGMKGDAYNPDN